MKFKDEDVSAIWKLYGEERVKAFEAAYEQFGPRMFAFKSFYSFGGGGGSAWAQACLSLLGASQFNNRSKKIKTIAIYVKALGRGGLSRCVSSLISIFQSLGFQIVFVSDVSTKEFSHLIPANVTKELFLKKDSVVLPISQMQDRAKQWEVIIRKHKIDAIYYAYNGNHNGRMLDFLTIRITGTYIFYHIHTAFTRSLQESNPKNFKFYSYLIRLCDTIVCLSRVDKRFYDLCQCRAHYIPNPLTFDMPLLVLRRFEGVLNLNCLWVGRIASEKCPLDVIPIFAKIHTQVPNATLTILGDAPKNDPNKLKAKMECQAKELNCANAIEWAGFQTDVKPYYERADLLISTSVREGFPLTHIEAYAYGIPVVAYDIPHLETLQNPKAARCVPKGDQQAAAEAAIELLTNPDAYREASIEARKVAEEFMNFDQAAAWKKVIEELPQPYTPEETEIDRIDRVMLETILLHGTWARLPLAAQVELKKIHSTMAWRIGRLITFIPRKVKGGIKCLRDNGVRDTLHRVIKKVFTR